MRSLPRVKPSFVILPEEAALAVSAKPLVTMATLCLPMLAGLLPGSPGP